MTTYKMRWLLLGLVCVAFWPAPVSAQGGRWEGHMAAGVAAYQQGRHTEAEKRLEAALEVAEEFGEGDPRLTTSLNNLAVVYRAQGKYAEAEPLHKRALAIREKALGHQHPAVAVSLNNLGLLYYVDGRYAEAEPLYERALAILEKALGAEHPHVAQSLENYAALLRKTGRDAEAARMEARAEAIRAGRAGENPAN